MSEGSKSMRMPWSRFLLMFALGAVIGPAVSAQQLAVTSYMTDDGLAHPQVWCVFQDSRGYLWIGTTDGVNRFDGVSFTTFAARDGLKNKTVRTIAEDPSGNLWFGTDNGLATFDGHHIVTHQKEQYAPRGTIWSSTLDSLGRLWFGTQYNGAVLVDGDRFVPFSQENGLVSEYVYGTFSDSAGRLWFSYREPGLTVCSPDAARGLRDCHTFTAADGLPDESIRAMVEDAGGNLWFGTRGQGLVRYDGTAFHTFHAAEKGFADDDIYSLLINARGELVVGSTNRGISFCDLPDLSNCHSFGMVNGLADDGVLALALDRDNSLWMGTENGLTRLVTERMLSFTVRDGLPHHTTYALAAEPDGGMWVGTLGGLAHVPAGWEGTRTVHLQQWGSDVLPGEEVWDLVDDPKRGLWVATEGGLCLFRPDRGCVVTLTEKDGLSSSDLITLGLAGNGDLLVSSTEGLSVLHFPAGSLHPQVRNYTVRDGLVGSSGYAVTEDQRGQIWLGTDQGLSRVEGDQIRSYTTADGLPVNEIFAMLTARDGTIWMGTNGGGLVSFAPPESIDQTPRFTSWGTQYGLPESVAAISLREDHRFWVGTTKGVYLFDPAAAVRGEPSVSLAFDKSGGLIGNEVNVFETDQRGRLWVGVVGGVSIYDPRIEQVPPQPPRTTIQEVSVPAGGAWKSPFNPPSSLSGRGEQWLDSATLELPHDRNSLRIEYRGLSFRERGHVRYQVSLVGFDPDWSEPTREFFKEYTNLDPGPYRFRVRASTRGSSWGPPAEVSFIIHPAWWQTLWFAILAALTLLMTMTLGYRWRTYAINTRNRELAEAVAERTDDLRRYARALEEHSHALDRANIRIREADRVKSEFLANMSHELRTPLNSIIGFSDVLVSRLDQRIEGRELRFLRNVQSSGRYLLLLINNLLDLSKIEAGR